MSQRTLSPVLVTASEGGLLPAKTPGGVGSHPPAPGSALVSGVRVHASTAPAVSLVKKAACPRTPVFWRVISFPLRVS